MKEYNKENFPEIWIAVLKKKHAWVSDTLLFFSLDGFTLQPWEILTLDCTIMGILTNKIFSSENLYSLPWSNIFTLSSTLWVGQLLYDKMKKN